MLRLFAILFAVVSLLALCGPALAQRPQGSILADYTAQQHGLTRAWHRQIALDRAADKIVNVSYDQGTLFIQTRQALVHAVDAETGRLRQVRARLDADTDDHEAGGQASAARQLHLRIPDLAHRLAQMEADTLLLVDPLHLAARETAAFLHGLDPSFPLIDPAAERLQMLGGYLGAGYALPTRAGARAADLVRAHSSVVLDPTYGAKAFAPLLERTPAREATTTLFWVSSSAVAIDVSAVDWRTLPRAAHGWVSD